MKNDLPRSHPIGDKRLSATVNNSPLKQRDDASMYLPKVRIQKKS